MLSDLNLWFVLIPAVIIFIYGIENFSKEIQNAAGTQFNHILKWAIKGKIRGTILGALITALIQASAATTIIAISLVNAGTITFTQSLAIIFGANIGTTITSQIIALNLMNFFPLLIVFGFILSLMKTKYRVFGKPIFYFGLMLLALALISEAVEPLKSNADLLFLLSQTSIIPLGILAGILITALFNSSSVTSGLIIILAQNELIALPQAIPILFGANIGTTLFSILISVRMDVFAKRSALAHFLFNLIGVIIFIPLIGFLIDAVNFFGGNTAQQTANAHLIFNVLTTIILLFFLNQFAWVVEKILPTNEKEITLTTPEFDKIEEKNKEEKFLAVEKELKNSFNANIDLFKENNSLLFSNENTNSKISKLHALTNHISTQTNIVLTNLSKEIDSKEESQKILVFARTSIISEQISAAGKKIGETIIDVKNTENDFSEQAKIELNECISKLISNLILIKENFPEFNKKTSSEMAENGKEIRKEITKSYKEYLERLSKGQAKSGSIFVKQLSLIDETESKTREIRKFFEV